MKDYKKELVKYKRLYNLYKVKWTSRMDFNLYKFNFETLDGYKGEVVDTPNEHIVINAMSYGLNSLDYMDLHCLEKSYNNIKNEQAKIKLDIYLKTLNKLESKLIKRIIRK